MATTALHVLYEDNHLLAVAKPAGLPTMGVQPHEPSLIALAKDYLKTKYRKPGNVYLGVVSRVDAAVTGVVVFARTSKAAARLTELFRSGAVRKVYWALVAGRPEPAEAACVDWLRKDEPHQRMHVTRPQHPAAKEARLTYRTLQPLRDATLLEVQLQTGRKHQIRVQLAARGYPILGDRKYGSERPFSDGIALHARELELTHPVRKTPLKVIAPLPECWRNFVAGVSDPSSVEATLRPGASDTAS